MKMYSHQGLVIFVIFETLFFKVTSSHLMVVSPTISVLNSNTWKWESFNSNKNRSFYFGYPGYPKGIYGFKAVCTSQFPIQWNISGFIDEHHHIEVEQDESYRNENSSFRIKMYTQIVVSQFVNQISIKVLCELIENPAINADFLLFSRNHDPTSTLFSYFILPQVDKVFDSRLIPCPTSVPMVSVYLYLQSSEGEHIPVNNVDYQPLEGFWSTQIFKGKYTCSQGNFTVNVNAESTTADFIEASPRAKEVRAAHRTELKFECWSKKGNSVEINVAWIFENGLRLEKNSFLSLDFYFNISYLTTGNHSSVLLSDDSGYTRGNTWQRIRGEARCEHTTFNPSIELATLKTWSFEFMIEPEIVLNTPTREILCKSNGKSVTLEVVNCKSRVECSYASRCLQNVTNCHHKIYKSEQITNRLAIQEEFRIFGYPSGIVKCTVDGWETHAEYFESLSSIKYTNWKEVPPQDLIRLDEVPPILYTNHAIKFICLVVPFILSKILDVEVVHKNGSLIELPGDKNYFHKDLKDKRFIDGVRFVGTVELALPLDAVSIRCVSQMWVSKDSMTASRSFEMRDTVAPSFEMFEIGVPSNETFYVGRKNQRLSCLAKGEPSPEYSWHFNGSQVLDGLPQLKILTVDGESHLEFPEIENDESDVYSGEYVCVALNEAGMSEHRFYVNVEQQQNQTFKSEKDRNQMTYITVASFSVSVILTLFLLVVWRRYKMTKEQLRNLTPSEVNEFFHGRPEVSNGRDEASAENTELLPYNNDFEIGSDDLEFEFSAASMLGSGQFGYVLRGKIVSQNKEVALKIPKSTTNVTIFKSLLSEVKIMMFIGNHENVLGLIGVCTEKIQTRSIYIATDLCELGSLATYLRKSKPSFQNLIDSNHKNDLDLVCNGSITNDIISTLDLISFSTQIAKGMEFLAYKSVVHADLATRNVLLTTDKTVKISDFGLSRRLYESTNYVKKSKVPLPWRWMAIESLKSLTFSTCSDVWAYGVTLYEIFTLGEAPYPNETWSNEFVARLESGTRMGRPKFCTSDIYAKIMMCWENEPELRPSFEDLRIFFDKIYNKYNPFVATTERKFPGTDVDSTEHAPTDNGTENIKEHSLSIDEPVYLYAVEVEPHDENIGTE